MIAHKDNELEISVYDAVSIRLVLRRETAINLDTLVDELGLDSSIIKNHIMALVQAGLVEVIAPVVHDAFRYESANIFYRWKRPGEEVHARDRQAIG